MFWANDEVLLDEMLRNYENSKTTNFSSRWKVKILKGEMVGASFNSGTAFHSNFALIKDLLIATLTNNYVRTAK